jgi:tetratricopeptide (TPR) repeat protein
VASLVDKSLLRQEETPDGEVRFGMLATIQEYAAECLSASGEAETLRQQHARFYLQWVDEWDKAHRPLDRMEVEHDNLRAALRWFMDSGSDQEALQFAIAIWNMWRVRGHWSEGRVWLEEILARAPDRTPARALALRNAGRLAAMQGDLAAARSLMEESLASLRERGNPSSLPSVLNALGDLLKDQGDYQSARALIEESLAILRQESDQGSVAWALQALGQVLQQQGDPGATAIFEESLALFVQWGDRWGSTYPLTYLGEVAQAEGDLETARSLHEQSLSIRREVGHKGGIARSLNSLGTVAACQGDYDTARSLYEECLLLRRELGEKSGIASCLEGLAQIASGQGQPERAARLFGAAQALRQALGAPLSATELPAYEAAVAAVRGALDQDVFKSAWSEGRDMPLEQAIATALGTAPGD